MNWKKGKCYREIKEKIYKRDKNKCQLCGKEKIKLEIHHIDEWDASTNFETKKHNKPNNLLLVCHACHQKLHGIKNRIRNKKIKAAKGLVDLTISEIEREIRDEQICEFWERNKYLMTITQLGKIFNLPKQRIKQILDKNKGEK